MAMTDNLHWLGHSSFRWEGSKTVYFDPYKLTASGKKADIILISHDHYDHCSKNDISKIATKDTVIVASTEAGEVLKETKALCKELIMMSPGDSRDLSGIKVRAVPAYNTNKEFHPKASKKLGFIITMDGVSIYHAGDTDFIPEMKGIRCDIALLPVSGTYVMTADEAARAALAIKPKVAVPMHYGEVVGSPADAEHFRDLLAGKIDVDITQKERWHG